MRTFKYRWSSALGTSLACHVVALGLITGFMLLFPASPVNKGPIEVDLVTMSGGGGGGGGGNGGETPQEEKLPEIKEAKATPTAPPPVKTEPDPEAENDVHEVAPAGRICAQPRRILSALPEGRKRFCLRYAEPAAYCVLQ